LSYIKKGTRKGGFLFPCVRGVISCLRLLGWQLITFFCNSLQVSGISSQVFTSCAIRAHTPIDPTRWIHVGVGFIRLVPLQSFLPFPFSPFSFRLSAFLLSSFNLPCSSVVTISPFSDQHSAFSFSCFYLSAFGSQLSPHFLFSNFPFSPFVFRFYLVTAILPSNDLRATIYVFFTSSPPSSWS